jgi:hypothetical protein
MSKKLQLERTKQEGKQAHKDMGHMQKSKPMD